MLDHRTILHPTDFSPAARYALGVVRNLARGSGGEVLVVHVVPAPLRCKRGYRREIEERLRQLAVADPEVRTHGLLLAGDPATQILAAAEQTDCGLIVLGADGRAGTDWPYQGIVARRVRQRPRCPVLIVQPPPGLRWDEGPLEPHQTTVHGPVAQARAGDARSAREKIGR